jgi:release factor glutamine methyltransferase
LLVDAALEVARNGLRILDLGCGTGCLGISIALELRARGRVCSLTMVDASPEAVATSRNNARWLGVDAEVLLGDWWEAIATNGDSAQHPRFDMVVSNPPYVRPDDPHLQMGDLRFEPSQALVGHAPNADGLADYRRILKGVPARLAPGGMLLLEHGHDQQSDVLALVRQAGLVDAQGLNDLSNRPRAVRAFAPPSGHYD